MSKALVTESLLEDIGDAIRAKTGSNATMTLSQMASAIDGLTSTPIRHRFGTYAGSYAGNTSDTLSVSISAYTGEKCFIVLMHRVPVNTPSGWTLVDCTKSAIYTQYISIFSKSFQSTASETVTITKVTSGDTSRICAFPIYFNTNVSLSAPTQQEFDSGASTYTYTVQPTDDLYLAVVNHAWAGSGTFSLTPSYEMIPNPSVGSQTVRLYGFVTGAVNHNIVWNCTTSVSTDDRNNNRLFFYKITAA